MSNGRENRKLLPPHKLVMMQMTFVCLTDQIMVLSHCYIYYTVCVCCCFLNSSSQVQILIYTAWSVSVGTA